MTFNKMILILATATATTGLSLNASAGSYTFNCSNASGTVKIDKGSITLADSFTNEPEKTTDYVSTTLPFGDTSDVGANALSVERIGRKIMISKKSPKNECGTVGSEEFYTMKIKVRERDGSKTLKSELVICEDRFFSGHCI